MKYDSYTWLYPPRPDKAIPSNMLHFYEGRGWVGQMKKNGTCTVVFVTPEREVIVRTRHDDNHKTWTPTDKTMSIFKELPGKNWYVFVCELLHNKSSLIKDTIYIFDILVNDGNLLIGKTFEDRMTLLKDMFGVVEDEKVVSLGQDSHFVLKPNVWLAKTITGGFEKVMRIAEQQRPEDGAPIDEGIVLKNPKARLEMPGKAISNSKWQVKCRISHKNYVF